MGYATTLDYLAAMGALVFKETGLLPHFNPGLMDAADLAKLRKVSVSMGIMLESTAERLGERGGAHFGAPDKVPALRLATLKAAGEAKVPFTSRHPDRHRRDPRGTHRGAAGAARPARGARPSAGSHHPELQGQARHAHGRRAGAVVRRAAVDHRGGAPDLPRHLSVQAPPNLQEPGYGRLIEAGIDDWGGVSPVTPDHVNPERPWPQLDALAAESRATARC